MTNNSSDMLTNSTHLDLAGNLIIKARFNNNFKKTTINNDELTYDELILMLQRLFNGRFDAKDDVKLRYRDEDGDLVDIDNDSDLKSAIQSNRYLKLVISLGNEEDDCSIIEDGNSSNKISLSKKEFRKLTETMERILDSLKTNEPIKPENSTNSSFEPLNNDVQVNTLNNLTLSDSKEFDPLVNKSELDLKSEKSNLHHQTNLEDESVKSLNSQITNTSASERQPATLQPSAQQFQSTQSLQSKILNQSQHQQQPPLNHMLGQQQQQLPPSNQFNQQQQQQQPPQNLQHQQQHQQQNQPIPYRYGMPPPSSSNTGPPLNQPPQQHQQLPPTSRPTTFNPNELPQQSPNQFNPSSSISGSHPPSSYPTPSSTPANIFNPQQITSPTGPQISGPPGNFAPMMSAPSNSIQSGPPMMSAPQNSIQSGPPSAFLPPQQQQQQNQPPSHLSRSLTAGPPPTGPLPPHLSHSNGPPMNLPPSSQQQQPQNGGIVPQSVNQQPLGPPQFTQFPPTGPYPGQQQAPKANNNPFGRNGSRGYAYPQQFN